MIDDTVLYIEKLEDTIAIAIAAAGEGDAYDDFSDPVRSDHVSTYDAPVRKEGNGTWCALYIYSIGAWSAGLVYVWTIYTLTCVYHVHRVGSTFIGETQKNEFAILP